VLNRFTIVTRIRIMIGASIAFLCIVSVPGWLGLQATTAGIRKIHDEFMVAALALANVESDMYRARMSLMTALASDDAQDSDRLLKNMQARLKDTRKTRAD
jgi:methyl-accepting chemotaxis protein-1 (serine sensor receptor)